MQLFKVYAKVSLQGTLLYNSYYLVRAESKQKAREKAKEIAWVEHAPSMQSKLSVKTSLNDFVK